ncbi:MAG: UDP-N-acetylglucosamine 1-carboxyvinyltransferase [Dethiobacteria bacterium]
MDRLIIQGGRKIAGKTRVHGAKNSILPVLAASLLNCSREEIVLKDVPDLHDVRSMLNILTCLGATVRYAERDIILRTDRVDRCEVPEHLMREMRSSIFLMGPLLGRLGRVRLCRPGGCAIGPRPVNLHLRGLQSLGAAIEEKEGGLIEARGLLRGGEVLLDYPSVGATENLMMAAVTALGRTVIRNAAREPEIVDLQNFLNLMGARISGAGTSTITVEPSGRELGGGCYRVFPDRIVAGTYLVAAAITQGDLTLEEVCPEHMTSLLQVLEQAGVEVETGPRRVRVRGGQLKAVPLVSIEPYPGFPTDLQPPLMTLLALCPGESRVLEKVFQQRFKHVPQLNKMGARIRVSGQEALIAGVESLEGAVVEATDLRAGATLVLAGLAARGETVVTQIKHIDRGYENLHLVLNGLGARISRVAEDISGGEAEGASRRVTAAASPGEALP